MILGKILRDLREKHNYTQRELAKALNITPACLSKYETGRSTPSPDMLIKIADTFNVSVDYLLGRNSLQFDYNILNEKRYKNNTVFDAVNSIVKLNSAHRKLFIEQLRLLEFHNKYSEIKDKLNNK